MATSACRPFTPKEAAFTVVRDPFMPIRWALMHKKEACTAARDAFMTVQRLLMHKKAAFTAI
jgi:hypothetical protein